MTGAALQALATVGRAHGGAAQRAVSWLRANQNDDGGFGQFKGRDSNAQSTSYALQGLLAAGAGGGTVLARAGVPRRPPATRRQRGLLVVERADARLGDRPGADGAGGQAAADRGRAEEQADAREGGVAAAAEERPLREAAARAARSRARAVERPRRAARARRPRATPPRETPAARPLERRRRPTRRAPPRWRQPPPRAARHSRSPCRYGRRSLRRGGRARAPVGDPPLRAASALARRGIVRP